MNKAWRIILCVALLALITWLWWVLPVSNWIDLFRERILSLGIWGVVAFIVIYVIVSLVLGPASALTLTAGLAYGAWGFPLVVFSATLAAGVTFLIARYLVRDRVSEWMNRDPRLRALVDVVSDEGWRVVGLLRLSPVIPYGIQNYLLGLTRIGFVPYILATLFGIMPASALVVYVGSLGQAVSDVGVLQVVFALVGLLATVSVGWLVGKRVKRALAERTREE